MGKALHKLAALLHNGEVGREIGIEHILKAYAAQRASQTLDGCLLARNAELLAPSTTHGRRDLHQHDLVGISERVIPCERVFVAIGQDIDSKPFEDMGIACKWGCVVTDSDGAVPNFDGLFSGGDCQTGPATVIRAINAGRVASANIDRYLGFDHKIKLDVELPTVQFKGKHECGRCELGEREAGERIHDWNLVEQGLTEEEARQEASRCLRCDHFGFGAFRGGRNLEW